MNNVDDAEFILAHGTEALGSPSGDPLPKSLEELEQVLMLGLEKQLPMVVANPDYVTVEARDLRVMPGIFLAQTRLTDVYPYRVYRERKKGKEYHTKQPLHLGDKRRLQQSTKVNHLIYM